MNYIDTISVQEFISLSKRSLFCFYNYIDNFKNREDKDLIEIVKRINNEDRIKIIEIPSDVVYEICEFDYSGEYIEEKHRTWY